jgi:Leucine-rich repeat (LRR) protein
MSKNKLSNVPDSFAQLAALDHLILDDNIYESIPDIFGRLKSLKTLSAQRNQIQDMMALLDCTNLEVINLRKNKIERWPIDLPLRLPKLRSCKLSSME